LQRQAVQRDRAAEPVELNRQGFGGADQLARVDVGLAEYFGMDVTIVRLAFVVLTVVGGAGIPLYLAGIPGFCCGECWSPLPSDGPGNRAPPGSRPAAVANHPPPGRRSHGS
jgi:PspC domain